MCQPGPQRQPTCVTPLASCIGATGIACADAMPRPAAKAIEARSFEAESFMVLPSSGAESEISSHYD